MEGGAVKESAAAANVVAVRPPVGGRSLVRSSDNGAERGRAGGHDGIYSVSILSNRLTSLDASSPTKYKAPHY